MVRGEQHTLPAAVRSSAWLTPAPGPPQPAPGFTLHSVNATHACHTFVHGETGAALHSVTLALRAKRQRRLRR